MVEYLIMMKYIKYWLLLIIMMMPGLCLFAQIDSTESQVPDKEELNWQLILAADSGNADRVLQLLKLGADINTSTPYENITPLMYACQTGDLKTVKILVANGADLDRQPYGKETALLTSVKLNLEDVVLYLLDHGANFAIGDDNGDTPLHYAVLYDYPVVTDMLLYYGADINAKNKQGYTPLMIASYYNNYDMSGYLINKGADVNLKDNDGFSAVMFASQMGNMDIVGLLISDSADVKLSGYNGATALSLAIRNDHPDVVSCLLKNGVSAKSNSRLVEDPYKIAIAYNRKNLTDTLGKYGIKKRIWPFYDRLLFSYGVNMNFNDMMFDMKTGIIDSKYNTGFYLGIANHYWSKKVLVKENDEMYYQYNQVRSYLSASFDKRFVLTGHDQSYSGFFLGLKGYYTYGKNIGMNTRINDEFLFSPQLGFFTMNQYVAMRANYEYVPFGVEGVPASRINLDFILFINVIKKNNANQFMHY